MTAIIEVRNLAKTYVRQKKKAGLSGSLKGLFAREKIETKAVDNVSFSIKTGDIVGFLGPNGAGKTTTLKILAGILFPTAGGVSVDGYVPWERKNDFKREIGMVMGQKQQLLWDLPAADSFELLKEIYEIPERRYKKHLDRLIEALEVGDILNIQIRQLSLGQRMKMEIIAAILHEPKILFLDEPTLGLDVVSQKSIRDFFRQYNKEEKTTMLLTSHYMGDVKELCERVMIINNGKLVYDDSLDQLLKQHVHEKTIKVLFSQEVKKSLAEYGQTIKQNALSAEIAVPFEQVVLISSRILNELPVADITMSEPEAEEVIRELYRQQEYQPVK